MLETVAEEANVYFEVWSGGQAALGTPGRRTGSTRHDLGNAADVRAYRLNPEDGSRNYLDFTDDQDSAIWERIVQLAAASGATGIGAGVDYMGPDKVHIGYGNPATWGDIDPHRDAEEWLRSAYESGALVFNAPRPMPMPPQIDALRDPDHAVTRRQRDALAHVPPQSEPVEFGGIDLQRYADSYIPTPERLRDAPPPVRPSVEPVIPMPPSARPLPTVDQRGLRSPPEVPVELLTQAGYAPWRQPGDVTKGRAHTPLPQIFAFNRKRSSPAMAWPDGNGAGLRPAVFERPAEYSTTLSGPMAEPAVLVQPGQSLSDIAREHGLTLEQLLSFNPDIRAPELVHTGVTVNLVPPMRR